MQKIMICTVLVLVMAFTVNANAVTINFNALGQNVVVTNQYAEATFSSSAGSMNITKYDYNFGTSNYICTMTGGILNCNKPTIIDFTDPVNNLSFYALGDDNSGTQALVDVYENASFSGTVNVNVDGNFNTTHLVDLAAFSNVTRIEIRDITDGGGLAWDTFTFDVTSVPEPTTMLLLGLGLAGLAGIRKKIQ